MRRRPIGAITVAVVLCAGCTTAREEPGTITARDAAAARALVTRARAVVDGMSTDPQMGQDVCGLLARARGVLIAPDVLRGAFIVGAAGGNAVFMARGADGKSWYGPAFYTLGGVSVGLQIGGDASEILLLAMSERGATALLSHSVKLGVDAGIAAGPVGGGGSAATANMSGDLLSYARSKGAYVGLSLDGAVIATRSQWNHAYYGRDVSPLDILVRGTARSRESAPLAQALDKAAARLDKR